MPVASVLITTYNRAALLPRAIDSVLAQDLDDVEVVVCDDCSTDRTPEVMRRYAHDPRVRYVRHAQNVAQTQGDRAILKRFVQEQCRSEFFTYLCDDDYWLPTDLLARQVALFRAHPSLSLVVGGMAQLYPRPFPLPSPNAPHIRYERVGDLPNSLFARHTYPAGFLPSEEFLALLAADPQNRSILTGATLFRRDAFLEAGVFQRDDGGRWQAGYELLAGTATAGDAYYLDEPCVVATVELQSASYRYSQLAHLTDSLLSAQAAYRPALEAGAPARVARLRALRAELFRALLAAYLRHKIAHRLGRDRRNPLEGIERALEVEIASWQFAGLCWRFGIVPSRRELALLALSSAPLGRLDRAWRWTTRGGPRALVSGAVVRTKARLGLVQA